MAMYGTAAARILARGRRPRIGRAEERVLFVVGCPRSGTTFLAGALGSQPGLVDLGEVKPVKASIAQLTTMADDEAALRFRRIVERVRRLAFSAHLRGVEQTPETVFVLGVALRAFPQGRAVHLVRDGRDVVCSLLEKGWLSAAGTGGDDVGKAYGAHPRFWVEPARREEFAKATDATRAAWAWRRHVEAGRSVRDARVLELRYEDLAADASAAAVRLAEHFDLDAASLAPAIGLVHARSVGRWRRDLTPEQVADVERETGSLMRELGY